MNRMTIVLALACLALAACSGGGGEMVAEPAPAGWADSLQSFRAGRDDSFAAAPDTPLHPDDLASFQGLDYFPPDPAYRLVGELHVHETRTPTTFVSTTGKDRPAERYGEFRFRLNGKRHTLQVYRLLDSPAPTFVQSLFLPFTDGTTGIESYPAGRYVDLAETGDGRYVLDFNRAYNPLCAYGRSYSCPVTPQENRLKVRVEAGEKGWRKG